MASFSVTAQEGYEIGGWVGLSNYYGDLNPNFKLSSPGYALGIIARKNFNERVSLTGSFGYARVSAADSTSTNSYQLKRNLSFRSGIIDAAVTLDFNFFKYLHGSYEYFYTPYIFAGFGFSRFNPKAELDGDIYKLSDFNTEGVQYSLITFNLAYGVGVKYDLSRDWSINVTLSGRRLFTDYLDDVSQTYPDRAVLFANGGQTAVDLSDRSGDPDFARTGFQRGNQRDNDYYYFLTFSIVRYFGDIKCPKISEIK